MMEFYRTPLQDLLLKNKLRENPTLKKIYRRQKNITKEIEQDIQHRINGQLENFFTLFIIGQQGSLKSSVMITIASKYDQTFTEDRICFQYEEYKDKFETSHPKEIYTMDEQVFQFGAGAHRIIAEIQELIETLRRRQNSLIICSPTKKYFPEEIFTYVAETIDTCLEATCPYNPQTHEPRTCKCYEEKKSQITGAYVRLAIKHEDKYIGFWIVPITWNNPIWQPYEKRKDTFMQTITEGKKDKTDYEHIAHEINILPEASDYKNVKSLKLLITKHKPNLTMNESDMVAQAIKIIRKRGY